jgi:copper transport protein
VTPLRRALAALAVLLGGLALLSGGAVLAHAELVSSTPANQTVLPTTPPEIVLRFTEGVDPVDDSIRLVDGDGDTVTLGSVDQSLGDDTLRAPIPDELGEGTYVVGWQAISADSHRVRGAFTFSVGAASATAPGVIDDIFDASGASSESLLLGVGRFASFAGIGVLVGGLFLAIVLVPELVADRRIGRLLAGAALVGALGTLAMIAGQAHLVSGSYLAWGDVVDIQSGRWWLARLAALGLFALFVPARRVLAGRGGRVEVAVAGLAVFAVVAAGGHAVAGDRVAVGFAATVVHLAAMSLWLGGLLLVVAGVPRSWCWWTASRFSPWALGSVVALAATGSVNAWRQLGSLDGLTDSAYGRWLVVKLVLVVAVVAVAAVSRRMVRTDGDVAGEVLGYEPRPLSVGAAASDPGEREEAPALRRTVLLEVAGMALILMATAGLVNSPPPPSAPTTASASVVVGDRIVQVELEPAVTGGTEMHVYLSSPGGGLDRADEITVEASLPAADLGPIDVEVVPAGPNHVIGPDVDLPVAGTWTFEVTARFGEFDQVVFTVDIPVSD